MPWEGEGLAGGGTVTGGRPGSVCPQGWTEDFDRAQMATQVFIGRRAPTIPEIPYTWDPGPGPAPVAGEINLNDDPQDATHMYISRTDSAAADASIWLGYLHTDCTVTVKSAGQQDEGVPGHRRPDRPHRLRRRADLLDRRHRSRPARPRRADHHVLARRHPCCTRTPTGSPTTGGCRSRSPT